MSDQLSKVVRELRADERNPADPAADYAIALKHSIADRIEKALASATTPAEVEAIGDVLYELETLESDVNGVADYTGRVRAHIATLARQLAEAKAVLVSLLTEREHRTDGDLVTLADRCRHLSRGDRDCSQPMVEADGADALEAVQAIAEKLGVACTPEAIDEAIEELQDSARQLPAAVDTNAMRLLWLVIREAGAPGGVTISRHALHLSDWREAYITTTEAVDGSSVTYRAMRRDEGVADGR